MSHFIKTGFWEKLQKSPTGYLNLERLIQENSGGASIQFQDNGSDLGNNQATTIDLAGAGVSGVRVGNIITYTIPGGGGGSVQSVTGDGVDNTDPVNPVLTFPELTDLPTVEAALDEKMDEAEFIREETANYVLEAVDFERATLLIMNSATPVTITVNGGIVADARTLRIRRINTGQITFVEGASQNITPSHGDFLDAGENCDVTLTWLETNEWDLQNSTPSDGVPTSRTIAGVDLADNITATELNKAAGVSNSTILKGTNPNRFHGSARVYGTPTTSTNVTNTQRASQFEVVETLTLNTIQAEVTALVAASNFRLMIYADNGSCYPGALLHDSGNLSGAAVAVVPQTITPNLVLTPGLYWLSINSDASITFRTDLPASFSTIMGWVATMGSLARQPYWTVAQTYGASAPNPFPAGATINSSANNIAQILVRSI